MDTVIKYQAIAMLALLATAFCCLLLAAAFCTAGHCTAAPLLLKAMTAAAALAFAAGISNAVLTQIQGAPEPWPQHKANHTEQ